LRSTAVSDANFAPLLEMKTALTILISVACAALVALCVAQRGGRNTETREGYQYLGFESSPGDRTHGINAILLHRVFDPASGKIFERITTYYESDTRISFRSYDPVGLSTNAEHRVDF
jgi:hypothetical protein